jgi:peptidoglycan/LPS O-acetylase OafA/YrhL
MSHGRPDRDALPHLRGLDGLRGLALIAVLVYHLDRSWLPGGVLGMTVFFTLSGFLITSLLLREVDRTGRIDLRAFWLRRARRLAPAAVAAVGLIALLAKLAGEVVGRNLIGDAVGALTWTANWHFIASGSSYAEVFDHPSPFQHFWSLAIEEQLYVLLPLVAVLLLASGKRRWPFATVVVGGIVASTIAAAELHGAGPLATRAYFGTDARIAEPLVGALLAVVLVPRDGLRRFARGASVAASIGGVLALGAIAWMSWHIHIGDDALYRGGFLVTALLAAVIVTSATQDTIVARALGAPPLAALGRISYGVYLFHWPLFLYLDDKLHARGRTTVVVAQLSATLVVACLSYALLEQPIRRSRRHAGAFAVGWANASVAALAAIALLTMTPATPVNAQIADLGPSVDAAPPPPPVTVPPAETARGGPAPATAVTRGAVRTASAAPAAKPSVEDDPIVGSGGDGAGGAESPPSSVPQPTGDELRDVVVGDSLGHNMGVGLDDWAKARGDVIVYNLAIAGCPLSRGGERRFDDSETFQIDPKCAWWDDPSSERSQDLLAFQPQVVVISDGLNELLDRKLPEWQDWRRPGEPSYHQWLLSEYAAFVSAMRNMAGNSVQLLVLNAPCGDFQRLSNWRRVDGPDQRVSALDQSVYPVMVDTKHADLFAEICPDGRYSDTLFGIENARPDGIHLSRDAADELARQWLGPQVLDAASTTAGGQIIGAP